MSCNLLITLKENTGSKPDEPKRIALRGSAGATGTVLAAPQTPKKPDGFGMDATSDLKFFDRQQRSF